MEILKYIEDHSNWKELLKEKPYCLSVKEDEEGFVILKYDMINSDFSEPIVNECRGLILDSNNNIVCFPFYKFYNYGEIFADNIDWRTARVQQKIDGSIMKLWYCDGKWRLSTNNNIDAYKTVFTPKELVNIDTPCSTFGELFELAVNYSDIDFDSLNKEYTYIFELTSPYTKVVIYYPETSIWHIGTRDNKTYQELEVDIGVKKPASYPLTTLDDCIKAAEMLPADQEGFVVVDANWKRVKIKNPTYLRMHRMIGNGLDCKAALSLVLENEQSEFLCYFPEYTEAIETLSQRLNGLKAKLVDNYNTLGEYTERKQLALKIMDMDKDNSYYYFRRTDNPEFTVEDYFRCLLPEKLLSKLGY